MSGLAGIFGEALRNVLRSMIVHLAGWVIVLGIILGCGAAVYLLLRLAGIDISFRSGRPSGTDDYADDEVRPDGTPSVRPPTAGGRVRRFRRGPLSVSFESQPQVIHIDQQMLDQARRSLAAGSDLDDTCRAIDLAYAGGDPLIQKAFRSALRASLEADPPGAGPG